MGGLGKVDRELFPQVLGLLTCCIMCSLFHISTFVWCLGCSFTTFLGAPDEIFPPALLPGLGPTGRDPENGKSEQVS